MKAHAWSVAKAGAPLSPTQIDRRDVGALDVEMEILWSGICHSDVHQARGEWGGETFPMVPGHEIVGRVTRVGAGVKKFAVGDLAGIGCLVDSCRTCRPCGRQHEQFCEKGAAGTYNSTEMDRVTPTYGGYSSHVVVTEHFALKIPAGMELHRVAPLLCAGITTYSPLRQWNCKPGDRVAVNGLGGLGHMAVKIAAAMGAEVTMLSTSESKRADAKRLGATDFALTSDASSLKAHRGRFDLIIDTVSAKHDLNTLASLLGTEGTIAIVGASPDPLPLAAFALIGGNKRIAGSMIGGIAETQEMLEFCASKNLAADVEVIEAAAINTAYERMMKSDVRYRFVIDGKSFAA